MIATTKNGRCLIGENPSWFMNPLPEFGYPLRKSKFPHGNKTNPKFCHKITSLAGYLHDRRDADQSDHLKESQVVTKLHLAH